MDIIPELNDKQLDRLSEFFANLSLVMIGALVVQNFIGVDKANIQQLILGLIAATACLLLSLFILKGRNDD